MYDIVLVLGSAADDIVEDISLEGVRVKINSAYADGIATSVRAGLEELRSKCEAALIFLADQPMVLPATVTHLIAKYQELRPPAVIPTYGGQRGNPVLLDRSLFPKAMALEGDEGFRRILQGLPNVLCVEVDDPGVLIDIDTNEDLERCRALYRARITETRER